MSLLHNRLIRGYAVLILGLIMLAARRLLVPSQFDILPVPVAIRSVIWQCYDQFDLLSCIEPFIAAVIFLLLFLALGWGSVLNFMIATALLLPTIAVYYLLIPTWAGIMVLLLPPLAYLIIDILLRRLLEPSGAAQGY